MKILIVDDDKISRIIGVKALTNAGYEVLEASSAKQAIEFLESDEPIRLLISDIMMPDMSGLELLSYINKELDFMELPVIMYTAKRDRSTVMKALKRGAKNYIAKPIKPDVLIQKVNKVISKDTPPLVNTDEKLEEFQIDRKTYNELVEELIDLIPSQIEKMRESVEQKNFSKLLSNVNSLYTASLSLGAERILNVSTKLEKAAQNKDLDKSEKIILAMERELNILRAVQEGTKKTVKKDQKSKYSREYLRHRKKQMKEG